MTLRDQTRAVRETSLGWMIQRISRDVEERMSARVGACGLSLAGFAVLMTVIERGPLTQAEIGKRFGMPAYAISRALDQLEALGLVERRAHALSRRSHAIHATDTADDLAPVLHAVVAEVNAEVMAPLDPDERRALLALLPKLLPQDGGGGVSGKT